MNTFLNEETLRLFKNNSSKTKHEWFFKTKVKEVHKIRLKID